jgi:hypothetical protein
LSLQQRARHPLSACTVFHQEQALRLVAFFCRPQHLLFPAPDLLLVEMLAALVPL